VKAYCSYGLNYKGEMRVGSERGIAFLSKMRTIPEAHQKVESAISALDGDFHHRSDIGTQTTIEKKVAQVKKMKKSAFRIRNAEEGDFLAVHRFVSGCKPLEPYQEHFYKIMLRYAGNTCLILEDCDEKGQIAGFVMGFISQRHTPSTYFLWQIGISSSVQGRGLGKELVREIEKRMTKMGCRRIELTIDPENHPSRKLFERMGYQNISPKEGPVVTVAGNPAVKDYYRPGRHFMLYEKRL
jgi:L-2,4-diaminobutyric acid acetyltransferase